MTDKLREAAQQALEALEYTIKPLCMCWAGCENCDPSKAPDIEKAITDLRAALAQQAEPVSAADLVQRIRELRDEAAKMFIESGSPGYKLHDLYRMKLDAILVAPPQQPEPVQKPVAWNWMLDGRPYGQVYYGNPPDADIVERAAIAGRTVRLLYAAPQPQRPPLTDAEMLDIIDDAFEGSSLLGVVRAIERRVRGE